MITGLLWAIAIGVWLLVLIIGSGFGHIKQLGAQFRAAIQAWAADQEAQAVQKPSREPIDSPE